MRGFAKQLTAVTTVLIAAIIGLSLADFFASAAQALTPIQREIEKQRELLRSAEIEDRRSALLRLCSFKNPAASRAAASALTDAAPMVRAMAASCILSMPSQESVTALAPLLTDKDEFVRQHAAYALGETHNPAAVPPLVNSLTDKKDSVRAAAAVSLGRLGDATAVTALSSVISGQAVQGAAKKAKGKVEKNVFVLRAAAHSLGQIGNRAALPALIGVARNVNAETDVRREAVEAIGAVGDASTIPVLQEFVSAQDPYLADAAHKAIRKIRRSMRG
jgi:HEAT repeat protein